MIRTSLFALCAIVTLQVVAQAQDVAYLRIRFGNEKIFRPVALEFYEGDAPATVENFKKLARKGFYDGMAFHRAFPNTLVQTGDPLTRRKDRTEVGTGGPGYTIPPEIRRKHTRGALAMARLPDKINPSRRSNGSQFYACLKPMPELDGQYTVFGQVLYGMDTLEAISNKSVDSNDYPVERVTIRSMDILPREKLPPAPVAAPPSGKPDRKAWWKIFG